MIDLTNLPTPDFVESLSFESILAENKNRFLYQHCNEEERKEYIKIINIESEPVVKLLEEGAYKEYLLRLRVNDAARGTTLALSTGNNLDVVAANNGVERFIITEGDNDAVPPVAPVFEADEHLRERAQLSNEKISTAGHGAGYRVKSLDAHKNVRDVSVISPSPACVDIYVLSHAADGVADDETLNTVRKALDPEQAIPIADRVIVRPAEIVTYEIKAKIYLYKMPESEPVLQAVNQSIQKYQENNFKLGRDIRLSALFAALHVEGVQRVELLNPLRDLVIEQNQAPLCVNCAIEFGGFDE